MQPESAIMGGASPSRENGPFSSIVMRRDRSFWLMLPLLVAGLVEAANATLSLFHLNFLLVAGLVEAANATLSLFHLNFCRRRQQCLSFFMAK
jgi:hypothetical protein